MTLEETLLALDRGIAFVWIENCMWRNLNWILFKNVRRNLSKILLENFTSVVRIEPLVDLLVVTNRGTLFCPIPLINSTRKIETHKSPCNYVQIEVILVL